MLSNYSTCSKHDDIFEKCIFEKCIFAELSRPRDEGDADEGAGPEGGGRAGPQVRFEYLVVEFQIRLVVYLHNRFLVTFRTGIFFVIISRNRRCAGGCRLRFCKIQTELSRRSDFPNGRISHTFAISSQCRSRTLVWIIDSTSRKLKKRTAAPICG